MVHTIRESRYLRSELQIPGMRRVRSLTNAIKAKIVNRGARNSDAQGEGAGGKGGRYSLKAGAA